MRHVCHSLSEHKGAPKEEKMKGKPNAHASPAERGPSELCDGKQQPKAS